MAGIAGRYRASLSIPSAEPSAAGDPRCAIQTANVDTWDAETGLNDLGLALTAR